MSDFIEGIENRSRLIMKPNVCFINEYKQSTVREKANK